MSSVRLGKRLKYLRKLKKLSRNDVSAALHISLSTYSSYENDRRRPSFDTLVDIMDYFDVSAEYIFGQTEHPFVPGGDIDEEDIVMYKQLPEPVQNAIRETIINLYKSFKEDA